MIDVNTELELAKLRSLVGDLRDMMSAERPDGWESMPMWGGGGSAMDYSDFAFGFSINGAVVTANAGYLFHGIRTALVVASNNISITTDHTWIYVSYAFGSGSASITSSVPFPQHTATIYKHILYEVRVINGVVSVESGGIHHLGSITIPGSFA